MKHDLYSGRDPRELPAYTVPDAAHLAGVPAATLRSWVSGRTYPTQAGVQLFKPVIERPVANTPLLSFVNVIEAHVLAAIRRHHNVPLQNVRLALDYVRERFDSPHPLAEQAFETNGVDLFVRQFGTIINVSRKGQIAMKDMIEAHLERIEHDSQGRALKLFPFVRRRDDLDAEQMKAQPKFIVVDPRVSFGRPVLSGTGIPTLAIADRFQAGESLLSIAADYDSDPEHIEEALRYERLAA